MHPGLTEVLLKKFEPDRPKRLGEKGGKLCFFCSKTDFEKITKYSMFFSFFILGRVKSL
jgi:hypothetical protein